MANWTDITPLHPGLYGIMDPEDPNRREQVRVWDDSYGKVPDFHPHEWLMVEFMHDKTKEAFPLESIKSGTLWQTIERAPLILGPWEQQEDGLWMRRDPSGTPVLWDVDARFRESADDHFRGYGYTLG